MLASDLIMDVRASRTISADQVERLERMVSEAVRRAATSSTCFS